MSRATNLGPHDFLMLDQWGRQLHEAFGVRPYLVGSVARAERDWRDVDVRVLADKRWPVKTETRRRAINLAVSLWGRQVTGLPIDFQFQDDSEFHSYDGQRRNPLGISCAARAASDPS